MENESDKKTQQNNINEKSKTTPQKVDQEQNKENKNRNNQKTSTFQISSSNKSSYNSNTEPPKQLNTNFQISSHNTTNTPNVQPFSISSSQRPKQEFQISSSHQNNTQTNSRPAYVSRRFKQNFEISKQTGAHSARIVYLLR